jgi:alpha-aminoadipate/glutamate carrier protein LysW
MATCPECDFEIDIDEYDADKGDTLECDNCGARLEVVSLNPLEFDVVSEDEEEDDEFDDEEDDEDEGDDDDKEDEDWDQ